MQEKKEKGFPQKGLGFEKTLEEVKELSHQGPDYKKGKTWGLVYYASKEHNQFLQKVYSQFSSQNALNPMAFKSLKTMEKEVIEMTTSLFHGGSEAVGVMTSGGTESILMAILAYRQRARKLKPWVRRPEIIAPESVHVAFNKACKYYDIKLVLAPLNKDYTVDVNWVKKKINRNTIAIVGSAPQYPHGVIDDIEALGKLAQKKKLPLHVDACLGGFLLPFLEKIGEPIRAWDFRVPGVTSISADLHKYGFAAKGASTLTFRSMDYMKHQFFVYTDWPGGVYASPAMLGTRSGGPIAAAWAAFKSLGEEGYLENAKKIIETTKELKEKINQLPELEIIGSPVASIIAYCSKDSAVNIYTVGDYLMQKGWHVDKNQMPESLHAIVGLNNAGFVDEFITDLKEAVIYARENPEKAQEGGAAMYGMISKMPIRGVIKVSVQKMMEQMYGPEGAMPDEVDENSLQAKAQKVGLQVLEVKDKIKDSIKGRLPF